jgi:hypothetical protein
MHFKSIVLTSIIAVSLYSCNNDTYEDLYQSPTAIDVCDTATNTATYSNNVNAILTSKCGTNGCHNSTTMQSGYDFSSYANTKVAADNGRLVNVTAITKRMPPGQPLTDCEIKQITNWVTKGAQNN